MHSNADSRSGAEKGAEGRVSYIGKPSRIFRSFVVERKEKEGQQGKWLWRYIIKMLKVILINPAKVGKPARESKKKVTPLA